MEDTGWFGDRPGEKPGEKVNPRSIRLTFTFEGDRVELSNVERLPMISPPQGEETTMAHKVTFTLPRRELGREDIVFIVKKDDRRFGTLLISKGAVEWRPTNKVYRRKVSWDKFDQIMRESGSPRLTRNVA